MMPFLESFNMTLAEFGRRMGTELVMEDGRCTFTVDGDVDVELDYLDEAHVVVAWAFVGLAPEDACAGDRARALLALNEVGADNGGFSLSLDPQTRRVIAHDRRPAELFDAADRLAAWIGALTDLVDRIRRDFETRFPCDDILSDDDDTLDANEAAR